MASRDWHPDIVRLLLEHDTDIDAQWASPDSIDRGARELERKIRRFTLVDRSYCSADLTDCIGRREHGLTRDIPHFGSPSELLARLSDATPGPNYSPSLSL